MVCLRATNFHSDDIIRIARKCMLIKVAQGSQDMERSMAVVSSIDSNANGMLFGL